jgi:hypothetical protein
LFSGVFISTLQREQKKKEEETKKKEKEGKERKETDINEQIIFDKTIDSFLNAIPMAYKTFRKDCFRAKDKKWNLELLKILVEEKFLIEEKEDNNLNLHQDEQSLLIYMVNTICYYISQRYSSYINESRNPYVQIYIKHCKPVIAIDEATDFSVIDLLAMHSLRHPDISSVTLSGDLMQRMTTNGLKSWETFSDMVNSAQVENLTVSYRQSPTLLSLAQNIYQHSTQKKAEYISYMEYSPLEPKPLMYISENKSKKLNWIACRIKEIDTIYRHSVGALPSVAVFVPTEEDIDDFANALDEKLAGNIPVQGCHKGIVLGESSDVRIYAIDKIKGLEFEAVFFHDLDQLANLQDDILLKYLYVGLSRATFYLGVTLSKNLNTRLHFIEEGFTQNGAWQLS